MGKKQNRRAVGDTNSPVVEVLEPRILLSADLPGLDAVLPNADQPVETDIDQVLANAAVVLDQQRADNDSQLVNDGAGDGRDAIVDIASEGERRELIIVDESVPDRDALLSAIHDSVDAQAIVDVITLNADQNGVDQLTRALSRFSDLDAIHLISHGSDGELLLGSARLDLESLVDKGESVASWGGALTAEGDILIYGCSVAATEVGQTFVDKLAGLSGADVAASDDTTGHAREGGDWDLEVTEGQIETQLPIGVEAQRQWTGVLPSAPTDLTVDSTGQGGVGMNYNGGNDTYFVADDGAGLLGGLDALTIEASFSIDTPATDNTTLLSYADGSNDEELALFLKPDGSIWLHVHSNGSSGRLTTAQYPQLFDGEHHQVSVSWDSTNGAVVFYVDGQPVESFTDYQTGQSISGGGQLVIGMDQDAELGGWNAIDVFAGNLFDLRIFNDVRTPSEVAGGYGKTLPSTETELIAHWSFDDLSATGEVIDTVSGNDLTEQHVGAVSGFSLNTPELILAVSEEATTGTMVGTMTATDPDAGETFTYTLVDDASGRFEIGTTTGIIKVADGSLLDHGVDASHDVTVRVTDGDGLPYDEVFTIYVIDGDGAPIVRPDGVHLSFDGSDYVRVPDHASLQMTNMVTMEAWIKLDARTSESQLIVNKEGEYELGVTVDSVAGTGEIKFAIARPSDSWAWHNTGYHMKTAEWTHVAVSFDGSLVRTYVNGQLVDEFAQVGPIGDVHPAFNDLTIGGRGNDADERFTGEIDEVRVWNTARTQSEIQTGLNGPLGGTETGLAGYWRFDEVAGGVAVDYSTNDNRGLLGGAEGGPVTPVYAGYATDEDTLLSVSAGSGVLDNDTDADGDTLTVSAVNGNPGDVGAQVTLASGARLTLNSDGSYIYDPTGAFDYLAIGEQATEIFTYTAHDGSVDSAPVSVSIVVTGTDDAPVANAGADQTVEAQEVVTLTAAGSTDPEWNPLSYRWVQTGGPAVTLSDPNAVNPTFTAPKLASDSAVTFELQVTDDPGLQDAMTATGPLSHWALNEVSGPTLADSQSGNDGTYHGVSFGGSGVNGIGSAPTFDGTDDYLEIPHSNDFLLDHGTVLLWFDAQGSTGGHLFSKDAFGFVTGGHLSVYRVGNQVEVRLQSASADYFVTSTILPNRGWHHVAFTFGSGGMQLYVDGTLTDTDLYTGGLGTTSGGTGNSEPIVIGASTQRSSSGASDSREDYFSGQIDQVGIVGSQLSAQDIQRIVAAGQSITTPDTVTVNITTINDGPATISGGGSASGAEDTVLGATLTVTDPDGLAASPFAIASQGSDGTAVIDGSSGIWTYTPNADFNGGDSFDVTITDAQGYTSAVTVNATVNAVADAVADSASTAEDTAVTGSVTGNDTFEGTPSYTINNDASHGSVVDNGSGGYTYTPTGSYSVSDGFTYTVMSGGVTETATVTVTVATADGAPTPEVVLPPESPPEPRPQPEPEPDSTSESGASGEPPPGEDPSEEAVAEPPPGGGATNPLAGSGADVPPGAGPIVVPNEVVLSVLAERPANDSIQQTAFEVDKPHEAAQTFLQELRSLWVGERADDGPQVGELRLSQAFWRGLDKMADDLEESAQREEARMQLKAEAAAGVGISLTAGFVSWALRAGSMAASFLAAMPTWRNFDPMPVLAADSEDDADDRASDKPRRREDDSVDELFEN